MAIDSNVKLVYNYTRTNLPHTVLCVLLLLPNGVCVPKISVYSFYCPQANKWSIVRQMRCKNTACTVFNHFIELQSVCMYT